MTDQTPEQISTQTPEQTTDRAAEREEHAALVRRIEATITSRPALDELMYGLLEHLDRVDDSEENGAFLLAMLDFARKHPDLALIIALLGRNEVVGARARHDHGMIRPRKHGYEHVPVRVGCGIVRVLR